MSLPDYPYPGLRPFDTRDAKVFFGRGRQVAAMLRELEQHRFLAVLGASGSGKSSLVRAGLRPALEQGYLNTKGTEWRFVVMRPMRAPFASLADAFYQTVHGERPSLHDRIFEEAQMRQGRSAFVEAVKQAGLPPHTNTLLLVDQFEEIFRFQDDRERVDRRELSAEEREAVYQQRNDAAAFVNLLLKTAEQEDVPIYVVLTMRSDYIGDCDIFHGLPEALSQSQFLTPRLTRDQCRQAIEGPLPAYNGAADKALVMEILNEIGSDPDQLPLMQHLLSRMWSCANDGQKGRAPEKRILTLDTYRDPRVGGFLDALSLHADRTFQNLGEAGCKEQRIAEMMFRCLSNRNPQGRLTRRPATVEEIAAVAGVAPDEVIEVAKPFLASGRRFIYHSSAGGELNASSTLDISHEALLRRWFRISHPQEGWASLEYQSGETYLDLVRAARRHDDKDGNLWDQRDLKRGLSWSNQQQPTEAWARRYDRDLPLALTFLKRSKRKRTAYRWAAGVSLFILFCVGGSMAWSAIDSARRTATAKADFEEGLRMEAQVERDLQEDLKKEQERLKIQQSLSWRLEVAATKMNEGQIQEAVTTYWNALRYTAPGEEGKDDRESIRRLIGAWAAEIGVPIFHDGPVLDLGFSADGKTLVTISDPADPAASDPKQSAASRKTNVRAVTFWDVSDPADPRLRRTETFARESFAPSLAGSRPWVITPRGSVRFAQAPLIAPPSYFEIRTIAADPANDTAVGLDTSAFRRDAPDEGHQSFRLAFAWSPQGSKLIALGTLTITPKQKLTRAPLTRAPSKGNSIDLRNLGPVRTLGELVLWNAPEGSDQDPVPIIWEETNPIPASRVMVRPARRIRTGKSKSVKTSDGRGVEYVYRTLPAEYKHVESPPLRFAFDPDEEILVVANVAAKLAETGAPQEDRAEIEKKAPGDKATSTDSEPTSTIRIYEVPSYMGASPERVSYLVHDGVHAANLGLSKRHQRTKIPVPAIGDEKGTSQWIDKSYNYLAVTWEKPGWNSGETNSLVDPAAEEVESAEDLPAPDAPVGIAPNSAPPPVPPPSPVVQDIDDGQPDKWGLLTEMLQLERTGRLRPKGAIHTTAPAGIIFFDRRGENLLRAAPNGEIRGWELGGGASRRLPVNSPLHLTSYPRLRNSTGRTFTVGKPHRKEITAKMILADRGLLATGSSDWKVALNDLSSRYGEGPSRSFVHSDEVTALAIHPHGAFFASASRDRTVRLWPARLEPAHRTVKLQSESHDLRIMDEGFLHYSPDGTSLFATDMRLDSKPEKNPDLDAFWVAIPSDGSAATFTPLELPPPPADATAEDEVFRYLDGRPFFGVVAPGPIGKSAQGIFAAGSHEGHVHCWDPRDGSLIPGKRFEHPLATLVSVVPESGELALSGEGPWIVFLDWSTFEPTIVLDVLSGKTTSTLPREDELDAAAAGLDAVTWVSFHPTRKDRFFTGGPDNKVRAWRRSGNRFEVLWELAHPGGGEEVVLVHGSGTGRGLSTGSGGQVAVWNEESGEMIDDSLTEDYDEISFGAFDRSGNLLLTWGDSERDSAIVAQLWDVHTLHPLGSRWPDLECFPALRPDGRVPASAANHRFPKAGNEGELEAAVPVLKLYPIPSPAPADAAKLELFVRCLAGRTVPERVPEGKESAQDDKIKVLTQAEWLQAMDQWRNAYSEPVSPVTFSNEPEDGAPEPPEIPEGE